MSASVRRNLIKVASLLLMALLVLGWWDFRPTPTPETSDPAVITDMRLNSRTIDRIRAGEPYYDAVGDQLRKDQYPTKPVFNWRTPLHYEFVAAVSIRNSYYLLAVLSLAAILLGTVNRGFGGAAAVLGAVLPAYVVRPLSVVMPEIVAGVFILLSLGFYHRRRWTLAALMGVVAVFVRELAALYAVVAGIAALFSRRKRESLVWISGGLGYTAYYLIHVHFAMQHMHPGDLVRAHSWVAWQGYTFVLRTLDVYGWFVFFPAVAVPIGAVAGLLGTLSPRAPLQLSCALAAYAAAFCVVGQPFDYYWGYLSVGLWGYAFTYSLDGARIVVDAWFPDRFKMPAEVATN
jgi:hypothetical protein